MEQIKIVSLLAEKADPLYRRIAQYITKQAGIPAEFIEGVPWSERLRMIDQREAHMSAMCGLLYTQKAAEAHLEPLVAPVMLDPRYECRPIYFSDIVVRSDSPFRSFEDLYRKASWAYTETESHSGYNLTRYHLAMLGETNGYFKEALESGSHWNSLDMIIKGCVDASAIESTVLDSEFKSCPELKSKVRVIGALGPSQIPPVVVLKDLPEELRTRLRDVLINMRKDGQEILEAGLIARFVRAYDTDYDGIRWMKHKADEVTSF